MYSDYKKFQEILATKVFSSTVKIGTGSAKGNVDAIDVDALNHSSVGDFTYNPKTGNVSKVKGGGHGQDNIDFLEANGIGYNVEYTYPNGMRTGNIPDHKVKAKRTGNNQSWFPESWSDQN